MLDTLFLLSVKTDLFIQARTRGLLPECITTDYANDNVMVTSCLRETILHISKYLLGMAGAVCLFFIVSGAFDYVGGWKIEIKQAAKNKINYALGGLILVTLSWTIVSTLLNLVFKF